MYLKSLRLENIACFEELDLDFTDENGEPCKWVVLLGENGTGKSTILRMLASTALPLMAFNRDENNLLNLEIFDLVRNGEYNPCFVIEKEKNNRNRNFWGDGRIDTHHEDPKNGSFASRVQLSHLDKQLEYGLFYYKKGMMKGGKIGDMAEIMRGATSWNPFMYGYAKSKPPERWIINTDSRTSIKKIGRLFGLDESLSPSQWLNSLYLRTIHPDKDVKDEHLFQVAINLIEDILPGVKFKNVTIDGDVHIFDKGNIININDLSEGYRIISDFCFDLLRWLFDAFPNSENHLEEKGVVLVDEIDLHLHPRWQRTVVQKIRDIFPNLQFIVTSHSPFVAQDMTEKDKIIVLTRDGDKVTARQEKGFVKGWRADQILTSWLFGLETTRDEEIESLEKERRVGLQRDEENLLTNEERQKLDRVTQELEAMRSSDVAPDRQKLETAAALVMELMSKTL